MAEQSHTALEEVTQAAFSGVLRALEAREIAPERFPGPIIIGIIAWPELQGQGGGIMKTASQQE